MPFTFAHPAIVLPLFSKTTRRYVSATGLVVGSMAPDFESFIRMGRYKYFSHRWLGVLCFDLPLAFIIALTFHFIVRDALIQNLPAPLRERFEKWRYFDFKNYLKQHLLIFIVSLLVGICSHLLWDAMTHLNMSHPDSIRSRIMFGHFRVYILMQYSFSIIGLVVVGAYIYGLPSYPVKAYKPDLVKYWIYVLLVAAALESYVIDSAPQWRINWLFVTNVTIGCFLFGMVLVSAIEQFVIPKLKLR